MYICMHTKKKLIRYNFNVNMVIDVYAQAADGLVEKVFD